MIKWNVQSRFFLFQTKRLLADLERDLGIMFSTSLKWKNQVITALNRAIQMLGRIKKSFALFDCKLMRSLYLTFIRPYLEFAVPV
jgi:hypothetical protein